MISDKRDDCGVNPLISVIVPVYNVENYLRECLDSLCMQTYGNIEIILVNDGSTDNSVKICNEYVEGFANVRLINQTNQGLSAARNNAVQESRGEWILFVDSDDYIPIDSIQILLRNALQYNADLSIGQSMHFWEKISAPIQRKHDNIVCMNSEKALIEMCYGRKFAVSAWNKLYRRELVIQYPYPIGKIYEEVATTYKIIGSARKIVYQDSVTYFYRVRSGSIVHQAMSEAQLYGITASEELLKYIRENYPKVDEAAQFRCFVKLCDLIPKSFGNRSMFEFLRRKTFQYSSSVLKDPNVSKTMKLRCDAIGKGYICSRVMFFTLDNMQVGIRKRKYRRFFIDN